MIRAILWDLDDTLLAFPPAEGAALRLAMLRYGLPEPTAAQRANYARINLEFWETLERGETTRDALRVGRFVSFFAEDGFPKELAKPVSEAYEDYLSEQVFWVPGAREAVEHFHGRLRQYIVSNGSHPIQMRKLTVSGLGRLMDGVFLSEDLGAEKPSPLFFDKVLAALPDLDRRKLLLVGDRLSSDVAGGVRSGIPTCWYNPEDQPLTIPEQPDYIIRSLDELRELVESM